jgi:catechol 2,3-dioxygenase-like lactoylglutathione lyase family enzyme
MQSKIRHVAVMCQDAPRIARFYELLFNLTAKAQTSDELGVKLYGAPILGSKRVVRPYERTIIVSDGNIGFAFLRRPPGYPGGIDHFGIEVDDLDTVFSRMKERYPTVGVVKRPDGRPFASYSSHDPEGHLFDLTQPGEKNLRGVWSEEQRQQDRYIKHITIRAINPEVMANFYKDVFEFKEEEKALEDPNFYLTDGKVTLVLTPWKIQHYPEAEHRAPGFDHVGFKVESVETFQNDLKTMVDMDPACFSPRAPSVPREQKIVLGLLQSCRYGQYQVADPEGNYVDVSTM